MHVKLRKSALLFLVSFSTVMAGSAAQAGGFYLREFGTPVSLGTGGAAMTTNTFNSDAAYTNPAGMVFLRDHKEFDDKRLLTGGMIAAPTAEFDLEQADLGGDDGGNAGITAFIPSTFYVGDLNEKWSWGFSIVALQGGGFDYGDNWAGRYGATEVSLTGLGFSPSASYKINDRFSVGAGVSIIYTRFDMQIAINQGAVMAPDGKVKLEELDDWGYQPFFGTIYHVSDRLTLGAIYRAEMEVDLDGDLKFQGLVLPVQPSGSIKVGWDNPQVFEVGMHYQMTDTWSLFVNANWEEWSAFSDNKFTVNLGGPIGVGQTSVDRNWDDTWHLGVGFAKQLGDENIAFGFSYDSSVVSSSDRTIDLPLDRQAKVSIAYGPFKGARFDVAFGLTITDLGKARTTQTAQGGTFSGEFDPQIVAFLGFSGNWHNRGSRRSAKVARQTRENATTVPSF